MRLAVLALVVGALWAPAALAGEKKLPAGEAVNDAVGVQASVLDDDHLQQIFASDFSHMYVVVEVTLTPKGGKPVDVRLDDFLIRSEQTGEHTGPLLAAQIGGEGGIVVKRPDPAQRRGGFGGGFGGIMMGGGAGGIAPPPEQAKVEAKDDRETDPLLGMLKRKILVEKAVNEPVTGLLFFPMEKEKPKNLSLVYTTGAGKLRFRFK